jgi:glycine/D-amino acid oxidase-like deaminating enzyme
MDRRPPLRLSRPLWLDRAALTVPKFPPLGRSVTADVAIVGGGITGAAIAWRFADAGFRVTLVESARIGRGSTAASTALLMQEPDDDFGDLARRYGRARARRIWQLSRAATREFVDAIRQLNIECDLVERDSVYYALTNDAASRLEAEHRRRRQADIGGTWLTRTQLKDATGVNGAAGVRTHGNAQVDPYRCCLGFVSAAVDRGAQIFERSPVRTIRKSGDGVVVVTPRGSIRADRAVVATGYATPYFKPLAARFRMLHTYVVATRRLRASERRRIGLGPVMVWETGWPYHYARWTPDHRLMLGGGDRTQRRSARDRRRAFLEGTTSVVEYFAKLYPSLDELWRSRSGGARAVFEYAWEGLFAMTPDGLPYIGPHRRYPGHLFALGYGGNGMTFGFLASKLLLDWFRGNRSADHDLFAFSR